jgi:hypothetical protein
MGTRSYTSQLERRQEELDQDPLHQERRSLVASKDPYEQALGYLSNAHTLNTSLLRANVDPSEWDLWIERPGSRERVARAQRLGDARITDEHRGLALGTAGERRGQTLALSREIQMRGIATAQGRPTSARKARLEDAEADRYKDIRGLSDEELERAAAGEDAA